MLIEMVVVAWYLPSYVTISITSFHCDYLINHYRKANSGGPRKLLNIKYDKEYDLERGGLLLLLLLGCLVIQCTMYKLYIEQCQVHFAEPPILH